MKFLSKSRLVSDRSGFLTVYLASLVSAILIILGATIVQDPGLALGELMIMLAVGAVVALVPPVLAAVIPAGRRISQVIFGAALLPIVGAVLVNAWAVIEALTK